MRGTCICYNTSPIGSFNEDKEYNQNTFEIEAWYVFSAYTGSKGSDRMDIPPMDEVIDLSGLLAEVRHAHRPSTKRSMTSPSTPSPAATLSPGSKPADCTLTISLVEETTRAEVLGILAAARWQRPRLAYAHPRISNIAARTKNRQARAQYRSHVKGRLVHIGGKH